MMKFLVVGILAIVFLHSTAIKLNLKSIANKEAYLKAINDERRKWAKEAKIPNMNELIWDDFLETRAKMNDWESGDKKTGRYVNRDGGDEENKSAENKKRSYFDEANKKELIDNYHKYTMGVMEELTPGQQRIGCAPQEGTVKMNDGKLLKYKTLCIMEPEPLGDSWNITKGPPGSACPQGTKNDNGLCAPVGKTKNSDGGSQGATTSSRMNLSTASVESSTRGTRLFGVFLAIIGAYGMF